MLFVNWQVVTRKFLLQRVMRFELNFLFSYVNIFCLINFTLF